jgi:type II secretory pathway predicted ATPase ExeA
MYHEHWGLSESPFRGWLNPKYFYQSPIHEEALARLHFLVEQRHRLGLLIGDAGVGKSLLLEVFASRMRSRGCLVAHVSALGVSSVEYLAQVALKFGWNPERQATTPALWRMVTDRIVAFRYQQLDTVLLVDDADRASRDLVLQLTRLVQFDLSPESRFTVVLAGQCGRMGWLGSGLLDMAELRIDLEAWDPDDTAGYVKAALTRAGGRAAIFADDALAKIHDLAHGVPRRVMQLADLALAAGAGMQLDVIDVQTVESTCNELALVEVR